MVLHKTCLGLTYHDIKIADLKKEGVKIRDNMSIAELLDIVEDLF